MDGEYKSDRYSMTTAMIQLTERMLSCILVLSDPRSINNTVTYAILKRNILFVVWGWGGGRGYGGGVGSFVIMCIYFPQ